MVGDKLFCFIMGDLYTFFEKYVMLFYRYYTLVFKHQILPITLIKVELKTDNNMIDITKDYVNKTKWNSSIRGEYLVYVTWSYLDKTYKYVYPSNKPIEFPPYTLEQLRAKPKKKVISVNYVNEDENTIKLIKQFIGPMHNFYSDKCTEHMKLSWITDKQIDQLTVIDTLGNFCTIDSNNLTN